MSIAQYRKAIVAAVAAGAASLGTALSDDTITSGEWVLFALAVIGGLGITYAIPNKPTPEQPLPRV